MSRAVRRRFNEADKGFSLIELLVVIVIIGVLASVVGPRFFGKTEQGKIAAAQAQIENLAMALDNYQLDNGYYPSSEQGLKALLQQPSGKPPARNWRGPYMKAREVPMDPWGNAYQFVSPGKINPQWYDIVCYGKDGSEGGEGDDADITN
ncbi:type II secretion system major pseudopilin GspG [Magnetofaba australis]|uniref:Type II secretion system core protein G n=1 Tax=Magnetofaba australis IT-1 TaxID=1434232 RepID=A0A1Y2K9B5_9PROT|nr:type II secretion system major pseudopilin GspG [Magnetofaba australis]OSM07337.1 putative general secretion pathway protein G [Magnetofaba australis IT-1]